MIKILLVEDDLGLSNSVFDFLDDFADVMQVFDGDEGLYEAESGIYDLILLDLMLPGKDGFQVLKELRDKGVSTPVLIMTAKESLDDKGHGFELGADDYLVKPFEFEELLARLRALLRRQQRELVSQKIDLGEIVLDLTKKAVLKDDQVLELTAKEYEVLEYLARNQDHILSREQIRDHVWDFDYEGESNIIDVLIKNIRRKIDQDKKQSIIHTKRGVGYVIWSSE